MAMQPPIRAYFVPGSIVKDFPNSLIKPAHLYADEKGA
jgi:hypothetical protein